MSLLPPSLLQPIELPEPLVELRRLLTHSQGFSLAFVVCNVLTEERRLLDVLTAALPAGHQVRRVEASATAHELIDTIFRASENDQVGDVIFVTGLERLVPTSDPHPAILELLNQIRERFRRLQASVVFWVSDFVLTRIAREAPDFWAWRSGVFEIEFDHQEVRLVTRNLLSSHSDANRFANLPKQEREELYEVLQALRAERLKHREADDAQSAQLSLRLGELAYFLNRSAEGREWLAQAIKDYERLGDQPSLSESLHVLASLESAQGHPVEARRLLQRSLTIDVSLGDQLGLSASLHELARLESAQGNPVEAPRRLLQRSLTIDESLGNQRGVSASLHELASLEWVQGNSQEAQHLLQRSLTIEESLGDQRGLSASLHQLAILESDQGNRVEAQRLLQRSLMIEESLGDQRGLAASLHQLAILESAQGNRVEARRLFQRSLTILESLGDQLGLASSMHQLAHLEIETGNRAEAQRLWERSIAINQEIGNVAGVATTMSMLAQLEAAEDHGERALEMAREAVRQLESLGYAQAEQARGVLRDIEQFLANGGRGAEEAPALITALQQQIAE